MDLGNDDDLGKRASASHSHNIMRFGRGGHNIMHFGKRAEEVTGPEDSAMTGESSNELDNSYPTGEQMDTNSYDPRPFNVGQRSVRTRYFIPHAFIASLYTHPRPFLKKAAESRDNVFMHFG